ncbi:MAG: hypothetical protein LBV04_09430, partial [Deferribacteraceae bacterium]|nr:hypothetical protein [Deferribacteraceae bacterium]
DIARERNNFAASGEFMTFSFSAGSVESSFFSDMMLDVGRPLSAKYMETDEEFDDTILTQPSLYADISSAVLSYFFRKLTQGRLDLVLLTPPLDEPSDELISGVELGVRLNQHYGVRVKMLDNGTLPTYGMQLEFFPAQNVSIKLSHEIITNAPTTGASNTMPDTPDADAPVLPDEPSNEEVPTPTPALDNTTYVPNSTGPTTEQRTGVELNIKF